jgi:hypothetical protein
MSWKLSRSWNRLALALPRGPKGEKRPADVIGNAVHVMRIATGEIEEDRPGTTGRAKGGLKGGKARAQILSPQQRQEIARKAAKVRWSSSKGTKEAVGAEQGKKGRR